MVSTRKKARVSYVEPTEFDDDIGPVRVKSERELVLERRPVALPYIERPPKTENTTCHKILELPTDVLFLVLAQVHPQTLWAVASASKKLNAFLTSKSARLVWLRSFAGAKTYYNASATGWQGSQHEIQGAWRFHYSYHGFYDLNSANTPWDANRSSLAFLSDKDREIYHQKYQLPLEMPVCPSGIPEFVLARFLFSESCQGCGVDSKLYYYRAMKPAWALLKHFCPQCNAARISSMKTLLTEKQASTRCGEDYQELVNYTTFLLHEPFFSTLLNGDFPNLDQRMLYQEANVTLRQRYIAFNLEKQGKSESHLATWLKEKENANVKRVVFGREVQEYAYLFRKVEEREEMAMQKAEEDKVKAQEKNLTEKLCRDHSIPPRAVALLQKHHETFAKGLRDPYLLHETTGPLLMARLKTIVDDFIAWMAENTHWERKLKYTYAFELYQGQLRYAEYDLKLPRLSISDFWRLKEAQQLIPNPGPEDGSSTDTLVQAGFWRRREQLLLSARLRCATIRDDLFAKLLQRDDDLQHVYKHVEELPRKALRSVGDKSPTMEATTEDAKPVTEEVEAMQQAEEELVKLNHFTSIFHCTMCQKTVDWKSVCEHECITNDLAFPNYTAFVRRYPIERCKGIGYQSSRVEAPIEYPLIAAKLVEAIHVLTAKREWKFGDFAIPETHTEAAKSYGDVWLFQCEPAACHDHTCCYRQKGRSRKSFAAMMKHLRERISIKKVDVTALSIDSIRVFAGRAD